MTNQWRDVEKIICPEYNFVCPSSGAEVLETAKINSVRLNLY